MENAIKENVLCSFAIVRCVWKLKIDDWIEMGVNTAGLCVDYAPCSDLECVCFDLKRRCCWPLYTWDAYACTRVARARDQTIWGCFLGWTRTGFPQRASIYSKTSDGVLIHIRAEKKSTCSIYLLVHHICCGVIGRACFVAKCFAVYLCGGARHVSF